MPDHIPTDDSPTNSSTNSSTNSPTNSTVNSSTNSTVDSTTATPSDSPSRQQLQHSVDEDIRKMREAQQFRTLEEKIQDLKAQGIDPAKTFDTRGDEDD